jgi:hypothetical protein
MTQTTLPVRKRGTPETSYSRLAAIAASQGLALLTQQWYTQRYD